ncbi:MAG: PIN/TRAM domain-containing protein [Bryobacteraceae bacterium]
MTDLLVVRICFVLLLGAVAFLLKPFHLSGPLAALAGFVLGSFLILLELRLKRVSLKRLIGASIGGVLGLIAALLVSTVIQQTGLSDPATLPFLLIGILVLMLYMGVTVGAAKGEVLNLSALGGIIGGEKATRHSFTILDTSVIIDGRIADIAETGFLDGSVVIPQFVLRELQLVADSADSLKRNRGRRGLDVLHRIQKMPQLSVQIMEDDFPNIKDVDMKLIELGKLYDCKVVTNDFNLNKIAQLHGVEILNINELANALKPIVLPGETMRVFVLKEGKEYNQGVAYLDDGTMVVVDNARKMISKTIDISVTSVLQTTAGKMIFGRFDERSHAVYEKPNANERHHDRSPREQSSAAAGPPA